MNNIIVVWKCWPLSLLKSEIDDIKFKYIFISYFYFIDGEEQHHESLMISEDE